MRDVIWTIKPTLISLKWAAIAVFAPEISFTKAVDDLRSALYLRNALHRDCPDSQEHWTLTHMLFANMGGFALKVVTVTSSEDADTREKLHQTVYLDAADIYLYVARYRYLPPSCPWTKDDIMDKSKKDSFSKILALLQIVYFSASIFSRAAAGLPITLLELGVLGLAACSVFTFGLPLPKPKSVNTVFYFNASICDLEPLNHVDDSPPSASNVSVPQATDTSRGHDLHLIGRNGRIHNWDGWRSHLYGRSGCHLRNLGIALMAFLVGAVHLAAWNFDFPSNTDKWLWRTAALVSASSLSLPFIVQIFDVASYFPNERHSTMQMLSPSWMFWGWSGGSLAEALLPGIPVGLYLISRTVLISLMIRGLFYLSPETFVATWTSDVPHLV